MLKAQQKCTLKKKKEEEDGRGCEDQKEGKMENGEHEGRNNERREMKKRR